jgi:exodeoxyribonuclease V gamma subunit
MPNGLYIHSSNRLEELAKLLAESLRGAGGDLLRREVVVVQTPGVARWLSLCLADELGCCMNVEYLFPRNFVDAMCGGLLGGKAPAHPDVGRLGWRIFARLSEVAAMPGAEALARYLAGGSALKRWRLAGKLADLFDRYLVHRPEIVAGWEAGAEPGEWQAELWRDLASVERIPSLASVFPELEAAEPVAGVLPERVFLFGLSTLPQLYVDFLKLLGGRMDVELFALAPSEEFWGDLPGKKAAAVAEEAGLDDGFGQPLLSSMGAQGRDFANMLMDADFSPSGDCFAEPGGETTLARLQGDLLHLSPRHEQPSPLADGSIEVASSAGPMREVEALRDHVLALLDRDPTLLPRDILVLAPDISKYAPSIEAVFGTKGGTRDIPFAVSDRSVRESPAIDAFLRAMELVLTRRTVRDLLEYLEHPAVSRRFGFDDESLAVVRKMCVKTGVRWGLDGADREALGFGQEEANSWKAGMDGLVLGVMMAGNDENVFAGVAPYAEAEGDRVETVAKLVAAFDALRGAFRSFEASRPLAEWPDVIEACVAALLPEGAEFAQGRSAISAAAETLRSYAAEAGGDAVDVSTVRAAMEEMLEAAAAPHGFLSGGVTFAELKPMRSVPARAICLLGMDDTAFPRQDRPLSFDRIRLHPRPGDRSIRAGDRYLFLETLLCVRDHLYISYSGVSPHGEKDSPPSVVVTELLEYLGKDSDTLVTRHALQPFSPSYFSGGKLFSYSEADCVAAARLLAPRSIPEFSTRPLAAPEELLALDFDSLVEFLVHPCEYFLRNVFGMAAPSEWELPPEEEPQKLEGLDLYGESVRYVGHYLEHESADRALARTKASGVLPWGPAREAEVFAAASNAKAFSNAVMPIVTGDSSGVAGDFAAGGVTLRARLGPVVNGRLVFYRYARLRTKDRLRAWVAAVVIGALAEGGDAEAANVAGVTILCRDAKLDVVPPNEARRRLTDFLSIYREGLTRPLPVFPESTYAAGVLPQRSKKSPYERAMDKWCPASSFRDPECDDPWNRAAWRGNDPLVTVREEFLDLADRIWSGYELCAKEGGFGA